MLLAMMVLAPAIAQKDPRAKTILDAMSKRYKSLKSYQAGFSFSTEGAGTTETMKGDLSVKGTKFRLKLGGQDVYNDGKAMYTYVKETNEVNVQDNDNGPANDLNPAEIYTIYERGHTYKFLKETKQAGRILEVIELTPEKKNTQVVRVQISVDKVDKSIKNWQITDKTGKRTTYTISNFKPNVTLPDTYFTFDKNKYPGVEVVDLR
jgi:outer membrane lipoprotein-sorting protein